jgi:hypothetical protein
MKFKYIHIFLHKITLQSKIFISSIYIFWLNKHKKYKYMIYYSAQCCEVPENLFNTKYN